MLGAERPFQVAVEASGGRVVMFDVNALAAGNVSLLIGACTRSVAFSNLYLCGEEAIAPNVICMCRWRRLIGRRGMVV